MHYMNFKPYSACLLYLHCFGQTLQDSHPASVFLAVIYKEHDGL